ncbi:MAG: transporter [Betaproteobacteria bacterium]|nr:transporter [Betaproteobacteria bacterium]
MEPRAFANSPIGLNFLLAGYSYTTGGVAVDPTLPLTNADVAVNSATVAYARTLAFFGQSAKFDISVPYGWLSGSAAFAGQPFEREVSGSGDPRLRVSYNFYGAPALSMKEFAAYQQDVIVGASFYVWAPLGQYDPSKLVNLGTNRWAYKVELGISKAIGPWTLELVPGATLFGDNTDFLGGHTRSQDPLYSVQAHVIYAFDSGIWMALDATYFTGGQTSVDGISDANRQSNSRVGVTAAMPIDSNNSIKFYATSGLSTRTGSDFSTFGLAWQYRWGGM